MKLLKRITIIAITLLLFTTVNVYAGTTGAKLIATSNNAKVGETVTITLSCYQNNGVEGFDSTLIYDKTKLKLINESQIATEGYTSISGTDELTGDFKLSLMYGNSENSPTEANIAQLKFEVLSGAKVNDILNIKLTDIVLADSDIKQKQLEDVEINIKVVEETQNSEVDNNETKESSTMHGKNNTTWGNDSKQVEYFKLGIKSLLVILVTVVVIAGIIYLKVNKNRTKKHK